MSFTDQAVTFDCNDDILVGVLTRPREPNGTAVVVVVGGPQYRVGSHRQFVLLARALGTRGYTVLRFDFRGMGDSTGAAQDFESATADIGEAINFVEREVGSIERIVLWGLCDGASAALLYCDETHDARVAAVCVLNPWVRTELGLARTRVRHYYLERLAQRAFWAKLLKGGISFGALGEWAGSLRTVMSSRRQRGASAAFPARMARAWRSRERRMLLLLSGADYTAKEFIDHASREPAWSGALRRAGLQRHDLPKADHTFSEAAHRREVERLTLEWLDHGTRDAVRSSSP